MTAEEGQLSPQQRLLLGESPPPTPARPPRRVIETTSDALLREIVDLLSAKATVGPAYIREQYKIVERKHIVLPLTLPPYYEFKNQAIAELLIITDSIVMFDFNQATSADSPQIAGTATSYAVLSFGVELLPKPKQFFATLVSGTGNIWLLGGV